MKVIVGGISSVHDALLAAALRCHGVDAEPLTTPDATCLASGRALLARGHCNPTYYLAGALVEHLRGAARQRDLSPEDVAARYGYLTAGSCGPCRFATYAAEYRRALAAAGFGAVPGAILDPSNPAGTHEMASIGVHVTARLLRSLVGAVLIGDALTRTACVYRARARDAEAVDALVADARRQLEQRLAADAPVLPTLDTLGADLRRLPAKQSAAPPVRVRVTGQFFASITDGDGGGHMVRELERLGADVELPAVAEWLLYLAWQARQPVIYPTVPAQTSDDPAASTRGRHAARIDQAIRAGYRRYARAVGARPDELPDMTDLQQLAAPHYRPELRGGMAHLEVAHLLRADRDGLADLVVSIKPFGCLPSSAVSDAVARALERKTTRTCFAAIETTGDALTNVDSRLALAIDRAREC